MTAQFDQQGFTSDMSYRGGSSAHSTGPSTKSLVRLAIAFVVVLSTGITIWTLISATRENSDKGILSVQVSDQSAIVTLAQTNGSTTELGKGSRQTRINPGTYTAIATAGNKRTLKIISVEKGQETTVNLQLQEGAKQETVASGYSATNVFATNSSVYFLNTSTKIPNELTLGEDSSRPVSTSAYPADQLYWLTPSSLYVLKNNTWSYMNNGQTYNLTANGPRLAERPADPANLVAFSPSGAYAYIDNSNNVRYVSSPSANPIKIGTADASTYKITMAADSSVTLYPIGNNSVKNYKTMRIKDGQTTEYKITTSGIGFLTWSPSLTKAAYTTDDGVYVYDVAKGRSTRLITVRSTEKQGIAWIDEDSFVFAFRNTLWRYTISTGTVNGLSGYIGTLSGNDPLRITDSFVYYGVTGTNNGAQAEGIYRTALSSNQQSSSTLNTPTTKYGSLNSLTSHGLSSDQMSNVQYALSKYASSLKTRPKEIVLGPITDEPKAYSEPSKIKFNLNVDGTARPARLEYSGLRVVRLYVYNAQGGVVFDSGEVN